MKKILAIAMTVAMILSMSVIFAAADEATSVHPITGTAASYCTDDFTKISDINVAWMPTITESLTLTDGDLSDWATLGLTATTITPSNMVAWAGDGDKTLEGFEMQAYFAADKDNLYIAFYIKDDDVLAVDPEKAAEKGAYGGADAFQINIDFGGKLGYIIETSPDLAATLTNTKNVFYSFGYNGDGGAVYITVQESDQDRVLGAEQGVIGATGATDDGWCAEFCLPFQEMYEDYIWKAYLEETEETAIRITADSPFLLGAGLYYQDRASVDGEVKLMAAAGTHSGFAGTNADGTAKDPATNDPIVRWDVYDNAFDLVIELAEGMEFTCPGILVDDEAWVAPETDAPETDDPAADTTADEDTGAADTTATEDTGAADTTATEDTGAAETTATTSAETTATPDKGGCGAAIGMGAVAVLAAAAAVVLKKKD